MAGQPMRPLPPRCDAEGIRQQGPPALNSAPEGAPVMNTATRDYPDGDLRVSDGDRDRALRELSEAFQAGRLTADEFDQRSRQALGARTGKELTVLLADLPYDRADADATPRRQCHRGLAARIVIGASAAAATSLAIVAVTNALSHPAPDHYNRRLAQEILTRMGLKIPLPPPPPPPGFDWVGTMTPAAIAVLLVMVIVVVVRVARASRCQPRTPAR
jgi:hypothetical protein